MYKIGLSIQIKVKIHKKVLNLKINKNKKLIKIKTKGGLYA